MEQTNNDRKVRPKIKLMIILLVVLVYYAVPLALTARIVYKDRNGDYYAEACEKMAGLTEHLENKYGKKMTYYYVGYLRFDDDLTRYYQEDNPDISFLCYKSKNDKYGDDDYLINCLKYEVRQEVYRLFEKEGLDTDISIDVELRGTISKPGSSINQYLYDKYYTKNKHLPELADLKDELTLKYVRIYFRNGKESEDNARNCGMEKKISDMFPFENTEIKFDSAETQKSTVAASVTDILSKIRQIIIAIIFPYVIPIRLILSV